MRGTGRHALFRMILVLGLCGCFACATSSDDTSEPGGSQLVSDQAPASTQAIPAGSVDSRPQAILTDVTKTSGIDFVHFNGTTGEYFLP